MHRIQQHILRKLILSQEARFSDIKPRDIDSNLFMYHLRALMRDRLVQKTINGRYELSAIGKDYAERMSLTIMKPRFQPRVVTMIIAQNPAGEYAFYRRNRQPLHGYIGFPYGKIHLGESVKTAVARELLDKTSLTADLLHRGDGYIVIYEDQQPISQIVFHLFVGSNIKGELGTSELPGFGKIGEAFWAKVEDIDPDLLLPSVKDLILLEASTTVGQRFFAELSYDLPL